MPGAAHAGTCVLSSCTQRAPVQHQRPSAAAGDLLPRQNGTLHVETVLAIPLLGPGLTSKATEHSPESC